jgi:hypothetical protein
MIAMQAGAVRLGENAFISTGWGRIFGFQKELLHLYSPCARTRAINCCLIIYIMFTWVNYDTNALPYPTDNNSNARDLPDDVGYNRYYGQKIV